METCPHIKKQQKNTEYMGEEVFIKMKQLDFTST